MKLVSVGTKLDFNGLIYYVIFQQIEYRLIASIYAKGESSNNFKIHVEGQVQNEIKFG